MSLRRCGKAIKKDVGDGLINELPNEILTTILILCNFTIYKLAQTFLLVSKRWRDVVLSMPHLSFGVTSMVHSHDCCRGYRPCSECVAKFVKGVNQFIQSYKGHRLLSVTYINDFLEKSYHCDIDRWLSFACKMRVARLTIVFQHGGPQFNDHYVVRHELLSQSEEKLNLKHLSLQSCILGRGVIELLSGLRSLRLVLVPLSKDQVENIMSSCLKLESLTMIMCTLSATCKLQISSRSLKFLKISKCYGETMELELSATCNRLEQLHLYGDTITTFTTLCKNSNLKTLFVKMFNNGKADERLLGKLALQHPLLETLRVHAACELIKFLPNHVRTFSRLIKLEFYSLPNVTLYSDKMALILNACPLLEKLRVETCTINNSGLPKPPASVVHKHLKEVYIAGFLGNTDFTDFTKYMLDYAISLERLIMDPIVRHYADNTWNITKRAWTPGEFSFVRSELQHHAKWSLVVQLKFRNPVLKLASRYWN